MLCHDAKTAEVVKAIRSSLEGEGMGDLALRVSGGGSDTAERSTVRQQRRGLSAPAHLCASGDVG